MNCYHCGKGIMFGRSHTHHRGVAGGRWKKRAQKTQRTFKPNLQSIQIIENEKTLRIKLCNKCLKRVKKDLVDRKKPFLTLVNIPSNIIVAMKISKPARNSITETAPVAASA